ncbi:MAG: hypothetical protein JWO84_152 [Parcubacteria group bacterium]|nr:hypothetical protein [Parcubacteria group bacterium]
MAKTLAIVFGIVFVLVGLLGWVPNPLVGANAIFDTNHAHDLVHLVFGLILLAVGFMAPAASSLWLKILGVVYLLIAVLGFLLVPNGGNLLGLVMTNMADHLLHVVLGIVLLVAGFAGKSVAKPMAASMPPAPTSTM